MMLTVPRNMTSTCLLSRGMPTIYLRLGKFRPALLRNFQSAKVGKFQPAETEEYSTGIDTQLVPNGDDHR